MTNQFDSFKRRYRGMSEAASIEQALVHGRWLHEWKPDKYPNFRNHGDYWSYKEYYVWPLAKNEEEEDEFLSFVAQKLYATDPSPDKKYFSAMTRWFLGGMRFDTVKKLPKIIEDYEEILAQNPDVISDPFLFFSVSDSRRAAKRRPVNKDPIRASYKISNLTDFIEIYRMREKRSLGFLPNAKPSDVNEENILHLGEDFHLYRSTGRDFIDLVNIELANGAIYSFSLNSSRNGHYFEVTDEKGNRCMAERMLRDIPHLANALAPLFVETFDPENKDYHGLGNSETLLSFIGTLQHAGIPSSLDDGMIAKAFEAKYQHILSRFHEAEQSYSGRIEDSYRLRQHMQSTRDELHGLYNDLSVIASFPQERELIDSSLITEVLRAASFSGGSIAAARSLPVINSVPEWRNQISADGLSSIFNQLAEDTARAIDPYTNRPLYDEKHKTLAKSISLIASIPEWLDGSEAEHLPMAIDYILHEKDWHSLKLILLRSTKLDNEVSQIWRDSIPKELRNKINDCGQDNAFKAQGVHLLMQRLDDLNSGSRDLRRLKDMTPQSWNLAA